MPDRTPFTFTCTNCDHVFVAAKSDPGELRGQCASCTFPISETMELEARPVRATGLYVLKKRGLYWRPHSAGYAGNSSNDGILYAGTYSDEESAAIVEGSHGEVTRIPLLTAFRTAFGDRAGSYLDVEIIRLALAEISR